MVNIDKKVENIEKKVDNIDKNMIENDDKINFYYDKQLEFDKRLLKAEVKLT